MTSSSLPIKTHPAERPRRSPVGTICRDRAAYLLGLGTEVPDRILTQKQIERELAAHWQLQGDELNRWQRICLGAGVEQRFGVGPINEIIELSTAERMQQYEASAPAIAERAIRAAIDQAGLSIDRVSDLVVVSCTGFSAPGLDVALMKRLGLRDEVRRTMIGFMGCFGAINGLRSAVGTCAADPSAVVLVVCCELCSLHVRNDKTPANQVACSLFGDGAAAAIVGGERSIDRGHWPPRTDEPSSKVANRQSESRPLGRLSFGRSRLIPESEGLMSWRITDTGFAMTLDRTVPAELHRAIGSFIDNATGGAPDAVVPHPGGPGVLDAIAAALPGRFAPGIDRARMILNRFGNMSSGTVLFALNEWLQQHESHAHSTLLLAFGPGLTIESIEVQASP